MRALKRVLVGIDPFSDYEDILKRALMIAKSNGAVLYIVCAVKVPWLELPIFENKEILNKEILKQEVEERLEKLENSAEITSAIVVEEGNPDEVILHAAVQESADMIIMGTNREYKVSKNIIGSTVQKVVHKSRLPVLIVKNNADKKYKNILAPTDFEEESKKSILFAKEIFPDADIKLLHVYETLSEIALHFYSLKDKEIEEYNKLVAHYAKNEMEKFLKEVGLEQGEVIDGNNTPKKVLIDYITKCGNDLTVIGSKGTAGINKLLGSMALYIMRESPTDVLVYVS
ncbi:universal stress protein [Nitrosophilus alvini]|uniref:universal stress protein n=1 Tax=Nitrosophilus alvini TaxID=2714855 RepID=UPI001909D4BE|nr:universal stress protein [Nitrosophilus alvini]